MTETRSHNPALKHSTSLHHSTFCGRCDLHSHLLHAPSMQLYWHAVASISSDPLSLPCYAWTMPFELAQMRTLLCRPQRCCAQRCLKSCCNCCCCSGAGVGAYSMHAFGCCSLNRMPCNATSSCLLQTVAAAYKPLPAACVLHSTSSCKQAAVHMKANGAESVRPTSLPWEVLVAAMITLASQKGRACFCCGHPLASWL